MHSPNGLLIGQVLWCAVLSVRPSDWPHFADRGRYRPPYPQSAAGFGPTKFLLTSPPTPSAVPTRPSRRERLGRYIQAEGQPNRRIRFCRRDRFRKCGPTVGSREGKWATHISNKAGRYQITMIEARIDNLPDHTEQLQGRCRCILHAPRPQSTTGSRGAIHSELNWRGRIAHRLSHAYQMEFL